MKNTLNMTGRLRLRKVASGVALGLALIMATAPAHADWRDHGRPAVGRDRDRDWHGHETRAYGYWHRPHFVPEPGVVYAPPIVYAPPPQYEEPGFNLVVPLNFR